MENLLFFDEGGKSLNFLYDGVTERHEGTIMFPPSSTDTFGSETLYVFERVPPVDFQDPENLSIRRFQLFNEKGVSFKGSEYQDQIIRSIEPAVIENTFNSRWVYGDGFESKFPVGSVIVFNDPIFDFTDPTLVYQVVSVKKGAFMVIGSNDNVLFDQNYLWQSPVSYSSVPRVTGLNSILIRDYVTPVTFVPTLSPWNERQFYDMLYPGRKLNLVNTGLNDDYFPGGNYEQASVVTISTPTGASMSDLVTTRTTVTLSDLPTNSGITMELTLLTDKTLVYEGQVEFFQTITIGGNNYDDVLQFSGPVPRVIRPGGSFEIFTGGLPILNQGIHTVTDVTDFNSIATQRTYLEGEVVFFNDRFYICVQEYTWVPSPEDIDTTLIVPLTTSGPGDTDYWTLSSIVPLTAPVSDELLTTSEVYLSDNEFVFVKGSEYDDRVTLASFAEKWVGFLNILGLTLRYTEGVLSVETKYAGRWCEFLFRDDTGTVIGTQNPLYTRVIGAEEILETQETTETSENYSYDMVFRSVSQTGLNIDINEQSYPVEYSPVFTGGTLDTERTVHNHILKWVGLYSSLLLSLGVIVVPGTRDVSSVYFNSITITTEYPNVPLDVIIPSEETDVYIPDTDLVFYPSGLSGQLVPAFGPTVDIRVNGRTYPMSVPTVISPSVLQGWVSEHSGILRDFDIEVTSNGNTLRFRTRTTSQRCVLDVRTGVSVPPGDMSVRFVRQYTGSYGTVITSNSYVLGTPIVPTPGFVDLIGAGLSTGMVSGLNNTDFPLQNKEYNIINLGQYTSELSYEGPFWGLTGICDTLSPFTSIAFNNGFTQSGCIPSPTPSQGGQFSQLQFSNAFSITTQNTTTYSTTFITSGLTQLTDILYVQGRVFVLSDILSVYDAITGSLITQIVLSGIGSPVRLIWDDLTYNILCLKEDSLTAVDVFSLSVSYDVPVASLATGITVTQTGDIWVTTGTELVVYDSSGTIVASYPGQTYDVVYNSFENTVYVSGPTSITIFNAATRALLVTLIGVSPTTDRMIYEPVRESVLFWDVTGLLRIENGVLDSVPVIGLVTGTQNWSLFDPFTGDGSVILSGDGPTRGALRMDTLSVLYTQTPPPDTAYGMMTLNGYDGNVYVSNQDPLNPSIIVFSPGTGNPVHIFPFSDNTTELTFNSDRNSVWSIIPVTGQVVEVVSSFTITVTPVQIVSTVSDEVYYGSLSPDYVLRDNIWIHTREYIRRPRFNRFPGPETALIWKWYSDNIPEFFLYDNSGKMLPEEGSLSYTGLRPLPTTVLNRKPNRDLDKRNDPSVQQTIFPLLQDTLEFLDSPDDISTVPTPLGVSIGYNSTTEGPIRSILGLWFRENVDFTINTMVDTTEVVTFRTVTEMDGSRYGIIELDLMSNDMFIDTGLRPGQHLALFIRDVTNVRQQYLSGNNGVLVKVREVFPRQIVVDFFKGVDELVQESTLVQDYPREGDVTYLSVRFKVWDREIGRFDILAQSEEEDERYRILLSNTGHLVSPDHISAYREYDIKEDGIDWTFLNRKRKEMLMLRHLIFPYVGAYKAIINAIGHFGYDDLELYEYYRNIDQGSPNFGKLFKVETPGAFKRGEEYSVPFDELLRTFPNRSYQDTRLFNLTYRITDREGNNLLTFSIEEVQKKLEILKGWLKDNVVPVSHRILDITGRLDVSHSVSIGHIKRDVRNIKFNEDLTPVAFRLTDIYLSPVNSGSTVYTCKLTFYLSGLTNLPDTYTVEVRTYGTKTEWFPLKRYEVGEQVRYFNKAYESLINDNFANDPRRYDNVTEWEFGSEYLPGDNVRYRRRVYVQTGAGVPGPSTVTPLMDNIGWVDVTQWQEVDIHPVQRLIEYRTGGDITPYLFTLDSNIDPFVVVEVTSSNGRGAIYRDRKNYLVQGTEDIQELEATTDLTYKRYKDLFLGTVYTGQ